ncbi:MAG TPA: tRNA (N6-threonylcarbamoyladenosine(37)-N6)-methyltransferase TrmO [Dehalococcoidia bacterium]|nr:tRNA (N6-threonylcarbamoyladenosine(37)-N6)-methyltransferase TrmO [Dehalococcoidia bacterium]
MTEKLEMVLKPIGFVCNKYKENPDQEDWWQELVSEIVFDENLEEGLDKLEKNSYYIILYWLHKRDRDNLPLRINPKGRKDIPKRGLFTTRTPDRPNPIGMITVKLLKREGNVLTVQGLDAFDGTPVIDIKPWNIGYDAMDGEVYRD